MGMVAKMLYLPHTIPVSVVSWVSMGYQIWMLPNVDQRQSQRTLRYFCSLHTFNTFPCLYSTSPSLDDIPLFLLIPPFPLISTYFRVLPLVPLLPSLSLIIILLSIVLLLIVLLFI